jgi:transcriptional regulator with XRE-family HTH domain
MLGNRLASLRKQLGYSQVELAAALGDRYDQTVISRVETGRTGMLADGLIKAAAVLGVSVDYLLGLTNNPQRQADLPVIARIEEINTIVEFGKLVELNPTPRGIIPVAVERLNQNGIDHDSCFFVRFRGDSMLPNLPIDCRLLIDRSRRRPVNQRVYLLDSSEGAVVKRLHWDDDLSWLLRSDNPDAGGTVPLDDTMDIIGEMMWFEGFA